MGSVIKRVPFEPALDEDLILDAIVNGDYHPSRVVRKALEPANYMQPDQEMHYLGATYEDLEAIARAVGMSMIETEEWIRVAESIPLSDEIAKYIRTSLEKRSGA